MKSDSHNRRRESQLQTLDGARQLRCSDALKTEKPDPLWIHYLSEPNDILCFEIPGRT
jgi:hypothetical protein